MNNVYYDKLFPSFVLYADNNGLVNQKIIDYSNSLIDQHGSNPFYCQCKTTIDNYSSVLETDLFYEIKKHISFVVGAYCKAVDIDQQSVYFKCSWLNKYKVGEYQDLHMHHNSLLSGVFYLQSDGEKDLIFQAPFHFMQPHMPKCQKTTIDNCHNIEYKSVVGRCYVFPSHLMHRTLPAKSTRMSISFNIIQR